MVLQELADESNDWDVFYIAVGDKYPIQNKLNIQLKPLKPFRIKGLSLEEMDNWMMIKERRDYVIEDLLHLHINPTDRAIKGLSPIMAFELEKLSRYLQIAYN